VPDTWRPASRVSDMSARGRRRRARPEIRCWENARRRHRTGMPPRAGCSKSPGPGPRRCFLEGRALRRQWARRRASRSAVRFRQVPLQALCARCCPAPLPVGSATWHRPLAPARRTRAPGRRARAPRGEAVRWLPKVGLLTGSVPACYSFEYFIESKSKKCLFESTRRRRKSLEI
jgi:hypothetical protein